MKRNRLGLTGCFRLWPWESALEPLACPPYSRIQSGHLQHPLGLNTTIDEKLITLQAGHLRCSIRRVVDEPELIFQVLKLNSSWGNKVTSLPRVPDIVSFFSRMGVEAGGCMSVWGTFLNAVIAVAQMFPWLL